MKYYYAGFVPPVVGLHTQVASDNGVPVINVGQYLWNFILRSKPKIREYLPGVVHLYNLGFPAFNYGAQIRDYLPDGVHPNDLGHQLYFESVVQFLASYFDKDSRIPGDLTNASLMDMSGIETTTCEKVKNRKEVHLLCTKGDTFSSSFSGDTIGLVGTIQPDGGRLECVVDNSIIKDVDFFDSHALMYAKNHTGYFFLMDDLNKTQHELSCTVLDQIITSSDGSSQGYRVELLYFMVNP